MKVAVIFLIVLLSSVAFGLLHPKQFGKTFSEMTAHAHYVCKHTTGVSDQLIEGAKNGQFPDDEASIQYYTLCLWMSSKELDQDFKMKKDQLVAYLTEMNLLQDTNAYLTCNENALKLNETRPHKMIWEMQKCIYKNIDKERYIFF